MTNTTTLKQLSDSLDTIEKPEDVYTVRVDGNPVEVFMSGGLVRQLAPLVGTFEDIGQAFGDPELQNALVIAALTKRSPRGVKLEEKDASAYDISLEEFDKFISWIMEHILYFFVKSMQSATKVVEKSTPLMEALDKLTQSQTGSSA